MNPLLQTPEYQNFVATIKERIKEAQYAALRQVNRQLIELYWDIGKLIVERQQQMGWGKAVVETLARDLQAEFAGMQGFSVQNLWYMRQLYLEYHQKEKLQPMVGEISWAKNIVILSKCKDDNERLFYLTQTQ
jgi:predicted nuclease of restriction endonuclease-like (RecB) superfamily